MRPSRAAVWRRAGVESGHCWRFEERARCTGSNPREARASAQARRTCPASSGPSTVPAARSPRSSGPCSTSRSTRATSHESHEVSLYRAEGVAADGVVTIAFLRPNGTVALKVPVTRTSTRRARFRRAGRLGSSPTTPPGRSSGALPERSPAPVLDSSLLSRSGSGKTYEGAGVSLATADSIVERLRAAVESTGAEAFGGFAGLYPLDGQSAACSVDGQRRLEADARAARRPPALGRDGPRRALHQRRARAPAPSRSSCSTTSPRTTSTSSRWQSSSRAPPRSAGRAGCVLIGGETAELPGIYQEARARLRGDVRRHRRPRSSVIDGSRCEAGDARDRLPVERPAHERLFARPHARG